MTAIKLSSIKTRKQFDDFADVWYQRTKRLIQACNDESKEWTYTWKARLLANEMELRVKKLVDIKIKLDVVEPSGECKEGFAVVGNNNEPEIIMDKDGVKYHK